MPLNTPTQHTTSEEPWRRNLTGDDDAWLQGERQSDWWTGKPPVAGHCPGVLPDGKLTSLPLPDLATCTRQEALDYFDNAWTLTEVLFAALQGEEAFFRPPYHHLRHPMIFYYAHPAVLYVNKLRVAGVLDGPLNAYYEQVFETGVDEMSWDDMSKNEMPWPSVKAAHGYRREVYCTVRHLLETHPGLEPGHAPIGHGHPLWAVFMGCEHERIHVETSSVLIRELPVHLLRRPAQWPADHPSAGDERNGAFPPQAGRDYPDNAFAAMAAGSVILGKPWAWPSFGWDNEYGEDQREVGAFHATRHLISNGEFHEFVQAGGYREPRYWSDEGWRWRAFRNRKHPGFWVPDGPAGLHRFKLRTIFAVIDMPWSWPADVTYHEAKAYCAWRQERDGAAVPYRLLTEAEHHRLRPQALTRQVDDAIDPVMRAAGSEMAAAHGFNLNLAYGSQSPVDALPAAATGFHDVFGNVWQWLEDHFHPLPGSRPDPLYDDFSAPCYDGRHQMMLGGSFVSTGDEASIFSRFQFRPHFAQHAGFRVVYSDDGGDGRPVHIAKAGESVYETAQSLNEYMVLHYAPAEAQMPYAFGPRDAAGFPARCARLVAEAVAAAGITPGRALDVGCAVGRSTFELARTFGEVVGIDLSAAFVDTARTLQRQGQQSYFLKEEGELGQALVATVAADIERDRVQFRQGDACSLPNDLAGFDAVLAANLLCRLPDPQAFLDRLSGPQALVRPGGILVMTTPFTWLDQFSPRSVWLGGYVQDDRPVRSRDELLRRLSPEFELVQELDLPLVIREHVRKYQYIVALATVWRRRNG